MIPTGTLVFNAVRKFLGDTEVTGGQIYTDSFLWEFLDLAYQRLYGDLARLSVQAVQGEGYYLLPAYTNRFHPGQANLPNVDSIDYLQDRSVKSVADVLTVALNLGEQSVTVTTQAAHGLTSNQLIQIVGVTGFNFSIDGEWLIEVTSNTAFKLNGVYWGITTPGSYVSGGKVIFSTCEWSDPIKKEEHTRYIDTNPLTELRRWAWEGNVIRVNPVSTQREVKIVYNISGQTPSVAANSLGIDGSLSYFVHEVVKWAALSKGRRDLKAEHEPRAEKALRDLKGRAIKDLQLNSYRPMPFREKRQWFSIS